MFSPTDPLVCHSLQLRPSLWAVVFNSLQELGSEWSWRQDDPGSATVLEVIKEIQAATDAAIFAGCMMIGQIIELATETPPGWVLRCDGATYENADYPELAAVLAVGYAVDADHFRVPDRNRRFGIDGVFPAMQGGEEEHTLTEAEIPSHTHSYDQVAVTLVDPGSTPSVLGVDDINTVQTGATGGGDPHNNMPPYEGTQFYIIAQYPAAG